MPSEKQEYNECIQEMARSFQYMIDQNSNDTKIYDGVVVSISGGYTVKFNGREHKMKQFGSGTVKVGSMVKVFIPQNNMNLAFFTTLKSLYDDVTNLKNKEYKYLGDFGGTAVPLVNGSGQAIIGADGNPTTINLSQIRIFESARIVKIDILTWGSAISHAPSTATQVYIRLPIYLGSTRNFGWLTGYNTTGKEIILRASGDSPLITFQKRTGFGEQESFYTTSDFPNGTWQASIMSFYN